MKTIKVYNFEELRPETQEKVVERHREKNTLDHRCSIPTDSRSYSVLCHWKKVKKALPEFSGIGFLFREIFLERACARLSIVLVSSQLATCLVLLTM